MYELLTFILAVGLNSKIKLLGPEVSKVNVPGVFGSLRTPSTLHPLPAVIPSSAFFFDYSLFY